MPDPLFLLVKVKGMKGRASFFIIFILTGNLIFSNPVFRKVAASAGSIGIYDKYELTIDLKANYNNPFDYDEISLQAIFVSPSGKKYTVDGFWYEEFSFNCDPSTFNENLKDLHTNCWKIRFTPFLEGTWKVLLRCTDLDGSSNYQQGIDFVCLKNGNAKGFIRKANRMYLKFDNGDFYFPVNINMGWCEANSTTICSYRDWIDEFSAHGGNNMRIMANSYWSMSLEKHEKDNRFTPGNYTAYMNSAFRLDEIMRYAAEKGVNVEFSMDNHDLYLCKKPGENCTFMKEHPYYCGNLERMTYTYCASDRYDCFRTVKQEPYKTLIKWQAQRTRYMIARWGYAVNLEAWEIMNEIDLMPDLAGNADHVNVLIDYLNFQIALIEKLDVYQHLVTVSGARELPDPEADPNSRKGFQYQMFRLPGIDFTSTHAYSLNTAANSNTFLPERLPEYLGELISRSLGVYHKPALIDETIWGYRQQYPENDPKGYLLHNAIWTAAFAGSLGSANPWDWVPMLIRAPATANKYFCPAYLDQIETLAGFMKNINLLDQDYVPFRMDDNDVPFRGYYLRGKTKTYGYIQNKQYDWENLYLKNKQFLFDKSPPESPASGYYPVSIPENTICNIPAGTAGSYQVTFYACDILHKMIYTTTLESVKEHKEYYLRVPLPKVDWDVTFVAMKL